MKKRGISLIVLIITIVVMIILATAIILNITNTNMIGKANMAVFKSDVSAMKDELSMYISDKYTETVGEYEPEKLQATEEGIWYGSTQEEGIITDILKSMNEKYIGKLFIQDGKLVANKMTITVEEEKWLDDIGVDSAYKTDIGKIEIIPSTAEWINGDVTLAISYTKEIPQGYVLEYKINDGKFQEGTQVLVEENNTKVSARLYSKEKDNEAVTNSYVVSNIDKEVPTTPTVIDITEGINSITAIATGSIDKLSGIKKYQYSIDNITWQDSGTFSGYKNATEVVVYTRAIDKVGNISEVISQIGKTTEIAAPEVIINDTEWTKEDVIASVIGTAPEGYVLEYKLSGEITTEWIEYTGNITIDTNNTTIIARYYNESVEDEIDSTPKTVSNIDKVAPTTPISVSISVTENTVTATAIGSTDTLSGFSKYQYSLNNSTWQDSGTFTGIKSGTETTIYARAIDKVGNVSSSKSNKGTTTSIGQVTISQSPAATTSTGEVNWTKGNVTVTLSHAAVSGYTLQYKLSGGMTQNWTTYSSAITIDTNNTTVATRMYNSTLDDEGNSANTKTISNIDKENPTKPTSVNLSIGTNSVTATASGSTDGLSGFRKYQYSLNNGSWQDSGTFTNIKSGTDVTIQARAVDKVGNVSESKSSSDTTSSLGQVTISQNPAATTSTGEVNWTSGNVTVTLSHAAVSGYTLQYKLSGGMTQNWTTYSSAITIDTNNTTVATRMYNSTLDDEGNSANTKTISNIDKVVPTTPTSVSLSKSGNTITATASGSSDTLSGFSKYQYSLNNSTWQDSGTFSGLTYGSSYTIYARAVDKVGNVSGSKSNSITLDKLSGGVTLSATSGTICVSKSTTFTVTNNTSGGTLSVSSSNTSVATVSISGTTITVTGTNTAGTATITVTSAETSTYNSSSATYAVTVAEHSATTGGNLKSSATCTAPAEYYYKCSRCGIDLPSTYTSGNALGHNNTAAGSLRSNATCTEAATYWYNCSRCGTQSSSYFSSGSALGHNYTTELYPLSESRTGYCSRCNLAKNATVLNTQYLSVGTSNATSYYSASSAQVHYLGTLMNNNTSASMSMYSVGAYTSNATKDWAMMFMQEQFYAYAGWETFGFTYYLEAGKTYYFTTTSWIYGSPGETVGLQRIVNGCYASIATDNYNVLINCPVSTTKWTYYSGITSFKPASTGFYTASFSLGGLLDGSKYESAIRLLCYTYD